MIKAFLIHNPISGVQNAEKIKLQLLNEFEPIFDLSYQQTKSSQHFNELLDSKEFEEASVILVCGGDGTVNVVAASVAEQAKILGILPAGSGNGLAKSLGIQSLKQGIFKVKNQVKTQIDILKINDQYSFNVSGIGFDAHVASLFEKASKRGFFTYLRIVLKELRHKSFQMSIRCDDSHLVGDLWLLSIANSNQWGNNIYINPMGSLQDEVFELVGIEKLYLYEVPKFLYLLLRKRVQTHPKVHILTGKEAHIRVNNAPLHIDGDYHGNIKEEVHVSIHPLKLRIFA